MRVMAEYSTRRLRKFDWYFPPAGLHPLVTYIYATASGGTTQLVYQGGMIGRGIIAQYPHSEILYTSQNVKKSAIA